MSAFTKCLIAVAYVFQTVKKIHSEAIQKVFPATLSNKPALVRKASANPRNGTPMGLSASRLAHRSMKHVIQAHACWNCTQSVLYTV